MHYSQITDHIWVGGELEPGDWERLYQQGIRYDLSLQVEKRDDFGELTPLGELWLPVVDCFMPSQEQLALAALYLDGVVSQGGRVVVHCKHGIGRAPMTVACYLIAGGMEADRAMALLRERRPIVEPNAGQVAVVREFERRVRAGEHPALRGVCVE